ncbi:MFS general substrate transporter [Trematosphaeria pertusa]|uniref:MFS general substrate transporter n=1 Tax=Trematosphaeria pertusa TaxID=390896 RepID=A0A6A6HRD0_9PLEO|nr:MFS general substrate transporter [Trematosphaeria pertusa]KAF2240557.1 MFS general substrate transporter [Trematosphaeria pertusa]
MAPGEDKHPVQDETLDDAQLHAQESTNDGLRKGTPVIHIIYSYVCILLLFVNYFLAQYDKFILSYFQSSVLASLSLTSTQYGLLSGYATGIVYAILALPIAFFSDYTCARIWILSVTGAWWSLCVIFQSLSHNFSQIFCARLGMGLGQASVEALSVSLISDLVGWRNVFIGESVFYVGVYIGEAISGQIATAFTETGTSWRIALRAIGITGCVIAVLLRLVLREPERRASLVQPDMEGVEESGPRSSPHADLTLGSSGIPHTRGSKLRAAKADFHATLSYVIRMRSFWLLVLSAGFRQLAGNVFGYYMPSYLGDTYPHHPELFSRYGIIVGVVGSVTVLSGGALTSLLWHRTKLTPIYLTAVGGMISSIFVLLMIFSRGIADGSQDRGIKILYGAMSIAYLTAEAWLGALFALVALLLPPAYKTFGLAIWGSVQVLIYSSGPEIIGLALLKEETASEAYRKATQVCLAFIIPVGYWLAGVGFLLSVPLVKRDLRHEFVSGALCRRRRNAVWACAGVLAVVVTTLFVVSLVYQT